MKTLTLMPKMLAVVAIVGSAFTIQSYSPAGLGTVYCAPVGMPSCTSGTRVDFAYVGDNAGTPGIDPCPGTNVPYSLICPSTCSAITAPTPYDAFVVTALGN